MFAKLLKNKGYVGGHIKVEKIFSHNVSCIFLVQEVNLPSYHHVKDLFAWDMGWVWLSISRHKADP